MAEGKASIQAALSTPVALPYPMSWIDRLMLFIERLPVPYWVTYSLLFSAEVAIQHVIGWVEGSVPRFTFEGLYLLFPLWVWGPLAIMTFLDKVALNALLEFRPLLRKDESELFRLQYELTTLPPRSVLVNSLLWTVVFVALMYSILPAILQQYSYGPIALVGTWIFGLISFTTGSAIYYHTIRQLRLVSQTVGQVEQFNLFRLDPVYAFSRLTARTGMVWLALIGLTLLFYPFEEVNVVIIALYLTQVVFALGAFILPLWNVHQRLVAEKRGMLAEVNRRVEAAIARMHRTLDQDDLSSVKDINTVLDGLAAEREVVTKIATWPWRPTTLSGFVSALVLPIALFLIQLAIRAWLGA
ncbi:MAG: hypothetical protein ACRDHG_05375 [Anaerolineales bacterium]